MYSINSSQEGNAHPNTTIADSFEQAWQEVCYKLSQQVFSYLQVGHFKLEYIIVDPVNNQSMNIDLAGIEEFLDSNGSIELQVLDTGSLIYSITIVHL